MRAPFEQAGREQRPASQVKPAHESHHPSDPLFAARISQNEKRFSLTSIF